MHNKSVDAYIEKAPEFARPILKRIRGVYHKANPNVEETIKWGMPFFQYKGILGRMAAFKRHADYGFWHAKLLKASQKTPASHEPPGMRGTKLTDISQLPPQRVLIAYVKQAIALNETGVKRPPRKKAVALKAPRDLISALKTNAKAAATFKNLSASHRNEYIQWITDAKQDATRQKRLATTLQWLAEGKSRNWKYKRK